MTKYKQHLLIPLALISFAAGTTQLPAAERNGRILIGQNASAIEQYAARELQR